MLNLDLDVLAYSEVSRNVITAVYLFCFVSGFGGGGGGGGLFSYQGFRGSIEELFLHPSF